MQTLQAYRICVYVPEEALEEFLSAVGSEIPSFLGKYDHVCWWSSAGVEQYRHIHKDVVERKASHRVEISLPKDREFLGHFIDDVVIPNHPWEEPVITVTEQEIVKHDK